MLFSVNLFAGILGPAALAWAADAGGVVGFLGGLFLVPLAVAHIWQEVLKGRSYPPNRISRVFWLAMLLPAGWVGLASVTLGILFSVLLPFTRDNQAANAVRADITLPASGVGALWGTWWVTERMRSVLLAPPKQG